MSASNSSRKPAPISFAASQYFDGNDGKWSSFVVRAGTPGQSFRVLPSTVTSETFLPLAGACKEDAPDNCTFLRGAEMYKGKANNGFQVRNSSTWHEIGIYGTTAREELGYNASGLYGLDTLGLMIVNSGGPTLESQVIGGVVNPRLWVGRLGMDVKPSNFSEFENPQRSMISTLKEEQYIPSLSYGYTAGAYYKKPNAFGGLTFGGYDQTRFIPNTISFPFDANDSRKPSLNIQAIVTRDMQNQTVSVFPDGPAYSLIDFAESQIWLPVSACDAFARAFNLTYDNSTDLYVVDSHTHALLIERNPSITFGLGQTANPGERINIVLPYSAFDQQASYPIYQNTTNYFPIRRAQNETQYTLGRTFFQEAYIRVDYERNNFSVHQALFPATNERQQIVPIWSPGLENAATGARAKLINTSKGAVAVWLFRRRKMAKERSEPKTENTWVECADQPRLEADGVIFFEKDGRPFAEMEGHVFPELHCPPPEMGELNVRITTADVSSMFQLYEMGDNERNCGELGVVVPEKRCPPPGWI
ncbi:acid protease [Cucurbitaria berberidis CBS 394.84]|uniref:Acid protease n=1 Tax=Cucurbitaria berberidis CBS 394.84 TaxID=1168544 RepID=A0A9P4L5M7_9PLEO|nr:acid protease [Cucurbitaria berberidis CBS 394.84]KAF1842153.1 acid protease [Cucurbitaria berberidis CBS 394.84]